LKCICYDLLLYFFSVYGHKNTTSARTGHFETTHSKSHFAAGFSRSVSAWAIYEYVF